MKRPQVVQAFKRTNLDKVNPIRLQVKLAQIMQAAQVKKVDLDYLVLGEI